MNFGEQGTNLQILSNRRVTVSQRQYGAVMSELRRERIIMICQARVQGIL